MLRGNLEDARILSRSSVYVRNIIPKTKRRELLKHTDKLVEIRYMFLRGAYTATAAR